MPAIAQALRTLGYGEAYHFSTVLNNPKDARHWVKALRAKYEGVGNVSRKQWLDFFAEHQAGLSYSASTVQSNEYWIGHNRHPCNCIPARAPRPFPRSALHPYSSRLSLAVA